MTQGQRRTYDPDCTVITKIPCLPINHNINKNFFQLTKLLVHVKLLLVFTH